MENKKKLLCICISLLIFLYINAKYSIPIKLDNLPDVNLDNYMYLDQTPQKDLTIQENVKS
jgi:hypothetical protein